MELSEKVRINQILQRARDTYGYANQITVSIEELCELATVLAKYPRYASHEQANADLHEKVVDELADVTVVCNHIQTIFGITDSELMEHINRKLERLTRWLDNGPTSTLEDTLQDREVK